MSLWSPSVGRSARSHRDPPLLVLISSPEANIPDDVDAYWIHKPQVKRSIERRERKGFMVAMVEVLSLK